MNACLTFFRLPFLCASCFEWPWLHAQDLVLTKVSCWVLCRCRGGCWKRRLAKLSGTWEWVRYPKCLHPSFWFQKCRRVTREWFVLYWGLHSRVPSILSHVLLIFRGLPGNKCVTNWGTTLQWWTSGCLCLGWPQQRSGRSLVLAAGCADTTGRFGRAQGTANWFVKLCGVWTIQYWWYPIFEHIQTIKNWYFAELHCYFAGYLRCFFPQKVYNVMQCLVVQFEVSISRPPSW